MTAPASTFSPPHRRRPAPEVSARRTAPDELGRYRFEVVTANLADAVLSIGGLIFDRAMAGWDVSVVIDADADRVIDDRPIRILGARLARRLSDPCGARALPPPRLLAVATDMVVRSDAMRRDVLAIVDGRETGVLLWGRHHPTNLSRSFVAARHRPSPAAHVFKSHALIAGGVPGVHSADEGFYTAA